MKAPYAGAAGGASRRRFLTALAAAGAASDLYLLLWNRRGTDGLDVTGDERVLDLWRDKAQVNWG